jgi:SAM-dependent methyltransferase
MGHFNHNDHYHDFLLGQVPDGARRALDVGCGSGKFARKLAARGLTVAAVDRSAEMIAAAGETPGVRYLHADVRELDLCGYDFVSCIASLHHLPFAETVTVLRDALRPGGVLAVLGISRPTLRDLPFGAVAFLPNRVRILLGPENRDRVPPFKDAELTLPQTRALARQLLPGARLRRHLYFRYSLVYQA